MANIYWALDRHYANYLHVLIYVIFETVVLCTNAIPII